MLDLFGNTPIAWDDFERPDQDLLTGDLTPSGDIYRVTGVDRVYIENGRYASEAIRTASIAYMLLDDAPSALVGSFMFRDVTGTPDPYNENAVLGTAASGFGRGSIQLGIWRQEWNLFAVDSPIVDPYPILGTGTFDAPLSPDTPYMMSVYHVPSLSAVVVIPPEGFAQIIYSPKINQYWGDWYGIQQRRPNEDGGRIEFESVSAFDLDIPVVGTATGETLALPSAGLIFAEGGNDTVAGSTGNDILDGGTGNDQVTGGDGDDMLIGGAGSDTLDGGEGNDTFGVDDAGDVILDSGGTDLIRATIDFSLVGLPVENLQLVGEDGLNGTGNDLANLIRGSRGADTLQGGLGADTIEGLAGADTILWDTPDGADLIRGGTGSDTIAARFNGLTAFVEQDTISGLGSLSSSAGGSALFTFEEIERLSVVSTAAVAHRFEALADVSVALEFIGNSLDDTLIGGAGDDLLWGREGSDVLTGGDGTDIAVYADSPDALRIDLTGSLPTLGIHAAGDTLASIEGVRGGDLDDHLIGDATDNVFEGGPGADTLEGGDGNDTVSYANSTLAVTVTLGPGATARGDAAGDVLSGFENITGSEFADVLFGNAQDNYILGLEGDNVIAAFGGADTVVSGTGSDNIRGGIGADELLSGLGADLVRGEGGADTIVAGIGDDTVYGGSEGDEIAAGAGNDYVLGQGGGDTVFAGSGDDSVIGGPGDDYVLGEGNFDSLSGSSGDDTLDGGALDDFLSGGSGADHLIGGPGSDFIVGGTGQDRIEGGRSNDTMTGSVDGVTDTFVYRERDYEDRINAFEQGIDKIEIEASIWDGIAGIEDGHDMIAYFGVLNATGTILTLDFPLVDKLELQSASGFNLSTLGDDFIFF